MSGNAAVPHPPGASPATEKLTDRRVLRTRDALGDALMKLIEEVPFDTITVQQVLERAGVSRSTFYTHFRDKDDLFLSDVEDFFNLTASLLDRRHAAAERLAPVRELFAHLADVQDFCKALVASGKMRDIMELGQGIFARSIEQRIVQRLALAGTVLPAAELKAQSHALSGALFAQLSWWLNHNMPTTPEAMDRQFHNLAWHGLRA